MELVEEAATRAVPGVPQLAADRSRDRDLQRANLLVEGMRRTFARGGTDETDIAERDDLAPTAPLAIPDQPAQPRAPDRVSGNRERAEA